MGVGDVDEDGSSGKESVKTSPVASGDMTSPSIVAMEVGLWVLVIVEMVFGGDRRRRNAPGLSGAAKVGTEDARTEFQKSSLSPRGGV